MAQDRSDDKFLFVVSSTAKVPNGRNHRRLIRRQAMLATAAKRGQIPHKNTNRRQLPFYIGTADDQDTLDQDTHSQIPDQSSMPMLLRKDHHICFGAL